MIIYGIMDCPDCRDALAALDDAGKKYEFRPLGEKVAWLKEFLKLRDTSEVFAEAKAEGYIGIPAFVFEDGEVTLELGAALAKAANQDKAAN